MIVPNDLTEGQKLRRKIKETQRAIRACIPGSKSHEHYTAQLRLLDLSLIEELRNEQARERVKAA